MCRLFLFRQARVVEQRQLGAGNAAGGFEDAVEQFNQFDFAGVGHKPLRLVGLQARNLVLGNVLDHPGEVLLHFPRLYRQINVFLIQRLHGLVERFKDHSMDVAYGLCRLVGDDDILVDALAR